MISLSSQIYGGQNDPTPCRFDKSQNFWPTPSSSPPGSKPKPDPWSEAGAVDRVGSRIRPGWKAGAFLFRREGDLILQVSCVVCSCLFCPLLTVGPPLLSFPEEALLEAARTNNSSEVDRLVPLPMLSEHAGPARLVGRVLRFCQKRSGGPAGSGNKTALKWHKIPVR